MERFAADRDALMPLPSTRFDPIRWEIRKADKYGRQIRYADRRGIPYVWFGDSVKDIRSGEQVPADPDSWTPPEGDRRPGVSGG